MSSLNSGVLTDWPQQTAIPGGSNTMRRCISSFQERCLPLCPMLPANAIQRDTLTLELQYAMAALGAQYIVECRHLANAYFSCAVERLNHATTMVRLSLVSYIPNTDVFPAE